MTNLQKIIYLHFKKIYRRNPLVNKGQLPTYSYNHNVYMAVKEAQLESRRIGIERGD